MELALKAVRLVTEIFAREADTMTEGRWRAVGEGSGGDVGAAAGSVSRIVTSWWCGFLLFIQPYLKAAQT